MEKILCAAIWYKGFDKPVHSVKNADCGVVLCGHRHAHVIGQVKSLTGKRSVSFEIGDYEQGFLTDKNRFVDRREANKIAYVAKQIKLLRPDAELYSEDLY